MLKRLLTTVLTVVAIAGFAKTSHAQYIWLDSNGDGVNTAADQLNGIGVPTTVDVYIDTNNNKDGSVAICDTGDGQPTPDDLDINSYVVNLALTNGTATFTNFINEQAGMTVVLFPATSTSTNASMANGSGTFLAPGTYFLMRVTCTLQTTTGAVRLDPVGSGLSPDPTSFGTHCSGNDFVNTYALGPNVCCATDWTDTAGLGAAAPINTAPVVANPGPKSASVGVLLSYTVTATDSDVPAQTLTFSLGAGAPAGAAITAGGAFTWTPSAAQTGAFPVQYIATDNGTPPLSGNATNTITVSAPINTPPTVVNPGPRSTPELTLLSYTVTATDPDAGQTRTFTLGAGAPAGAAITGAGAFTWTPTEAQGPGTFPITYTATDNGTPPAAGSATNTVTVTEVNVAPVVANPGNKTTNELALLTYTVTATDADLPANTLTFTLGAGAPAGAAITAGGVFSWTPTEAQGPGTFPVTYTATDNGTPPLAGSTTNTITVTEVNVAPVVTAPANQTVNEGSLLTYTVTATDADLPANTLTFTLGAGAPAGAAITAGGVFSWTPSEAQGPGTFPITYTATDNGTPPLAGSASNTVTVNEVNTAPVVTNPGNKTTAELALLAYTVTATDADLPANTLTFTLGAGAPAGAAITAGGNFTWTPTEAQGPGTFPVTYTATDNGTPPLAGSTTNTITVTEVNTAPVVVNPGPKGAQTGVLLTYTVTATDADIPANTIAFSLGAGAPAGAAITAGGVFSWTPSAAQTGAFPVTYNATDNGTPPLTGSATNTITVGGNTAPTVTNPGPKTTNELALLAYTVTATDPDAGQTVTFTLGAGAPAGAAITAGGNFTWTPTEAQGPGTFPVTYTATDNGTPPLAGSATNTITVNEVNVAPVVTAPANQTVNEGVLVSYTVTATDADLPANTLTFTLGAGAPAGAAISTAGAFTWTPSEAQGPGTFPITYTATDNGTPPLAGSASNTITVNEVNTAPVVTNPGNKTTAELALLAYTVTATDADLPAQTLTFTLGAGAPAGAAITAGGNFTWTPTEAQGPGTFPVTYTATDNGTPPLAGSTTNTITVTEVNVAPVVNAPANQTVNEGVLVSYTVTATDADLPANTLTFTLGAGAPAGAAITAAGAFTWTPSESQNGAFPITYTATDNGTPPLAGSASNTITVNEVNVAPVVTAPANQTVNEGVLVSYTVTATDADLPAQTLTFTLGAGAPAGAAITAGGAFTWTPSEAQGPGTFPITYTATDNGTPPLAGSASNTITVNEVNTAPVVTNPGNKTTAELALLAYTVTATDADLPAQTLTFTLGAGAPAGAAITAGGNFTWTPTEAQGPGTFPVTYTATDNGTPPLAGSTTNTITVTEVNTAPVVVNPGNKGAQTGVLLTYTVTATDADIPANTIAFSLGAGAPAGAAITAGGVFSWTPSAAQTGAFPVTYNATDNGTPPLTGSATNTITVGGNTAPTVTNPGPKTTNELALLAYTVTATDPDAGQTVTFTLGAGAPAGAAITAGGNFTWTPTEAQGPGTFPVTYTATDNGTPNLSGSATNTITVNEVNVAPVVTAPANQTVNEGVLVSYTVTATDADLPANTLTFTLGAGAPAGAAISTAGAFTWTPSEAQGPGTFPITYTATDNGTPPLAGSASNTITVNEVNTAPVVTAPANQTVNEGTLVSYTVTATDADLPANTLTFTLGAGAPAGAAITAAGAFTWTPSEAQGPGVFPITYTATDNGTPPLAGSASNTITVNEANNAPVVTAPANQTVNEGVLVSYTVTATDGDLPAQTITFSLGAGAPAGAAITGAGAFTWTPSEAQGPGTFPITYNATDNGTPPLTGSASNTITVNEVNTAPVVTNPGNKTTAELALLAYTVTATDADLPAQTLTFTLGAGAPAGAAITAGGNFTWTPTEAQGPGTFPVTYTATDNGTPPLAGSTTNTITVTEVNVAPVVVNPGPKTGQTGVLLTYTVTATDADIPANTIAFSLGAGAPAGAAITAGGVFSWTPSAAQTGAFPVTYNATDNGTPPLTGSATNTITVGGNSPPVVTNPGPKTTNELALLAYTVTATDPDAGQTFTFTLGAGAPAGAAITAGGNFTWTPTEAQGPGTFPVTYTATDNGTPPASGSATNTITVNEVNVAPVVTAPANQTVNEGTLVSYTVTATDADLPANTLTFTLGAGAPAGAAITAAGAFTWTPSEAQGPGTFPITYTATDNGTPPLSGSASNTITVNEANNAPVVANPGNKTTNEGSLLTYTVTATDSDIPAQTITFSLGAGAPAGAAITAGGVFSWTPSEAQGPGTFPVTYNATDNGTPPMTGSTTNTITVNEVNVAPVVTAPANQTVNEGVLVSYTVTATDADLPANTLTFTLGAGAPAGAAITGAGAFTWTPSEAQGPGTYPITYTATDNGTPPLSGSASNTITVNEVNTAPVVANPGPKSTATGVLLSYTVTATDADLPPQTLTFSLGAGAPAGAAITAGGVFSWTPSAAQTGAFPVTYVATDNGTPPLSGSATNTITVTFTNTAPTVTAPANQTVNEGVLVSYTVTATDPDAGQTRTFALGAGAPAGAAITAAGAFTWTPSEAQGPGTYPITYTATDNGTPPLSGSASNTITVLEVNSAPVVANPGNKTTNEGVLLAYTVTATDADLPANTITFTLGAGAPAGAAITAGGNFTWTPTEVQGPGTYPVTYTATDNGTPPMSGSATNSITVNEANNAPVVANPGNKTVDEGVLLAYVVTATDSDIPAQTLTFTLGAGAPAGAAITAGGNFTWTPTLSQSGTYPVTYTATDNGTPALSGSATNTITVNNVNQAPTLVQPADMTLAANTTADQGLTGSDPDGDALTFSKVTGPLFMTVTTLTATTGNIHLAPASADAGTYPSNTVRASDGALSDSKSFAITVTPAANHAPTADADGPYTGTIGVPVAFDGSGSSDPDGDALTYAWDFGDGGTSTSQNPMHAYAAVGLYNVTLRVTDTGGLFDDDASTANIVDQFAAYVFPQANNKIKLNTGKSQYCFQVQPVDGSYSNTDVDLSSIVMISPGTGSVDRIAAAGSRTASNGDLNFDGILEIKACFNRDDLRQLFSSLGGGSHTLTVSVEGNLFTGGTFHGDVVVVVTGSTGGALAATISPNPLNPQAVLTFSTSKAGFVKVMMFDVQGRLVRTLADNPSAPAGYHDVTIDGMNSSGVRLASGRYFVIVNTADGREKMSVTILK